MTNKLRSAFCLATLTFISSEPLEAQIRFGWRNRAPNILTKEFEEIRRNPRLWVQNYNRLQNNVIRQATPKERKELLRTSPKKDSIVVDLRHPQSEEHKKACTDGRYQPLTPPSRSFPPYKIITIWYDINEYGYAVNLESEKYSVGSDLIEEHSTDDIILTVFNPPEINGQKLFCKNASDDFIWQHHSFGKNKATRLRDNRIIAQKIYG
ncbi:MAG: hypothetical protein DI586_05910 [Micavibrio aeruginosavorus]|uniref:Uncharacterized protein n=1 Tax=Micavibrio aeruginosavorus TaxID=349221 RepID=A0A2W5FL74_9BACT|nr:MAG: hypothetical protein DI586_05910 [Micavibrio aeruginosavorus]